ncbi:MAG: hypothetical protein JO330_20510 [Mycobacteriaceae bacterium]|nr:hypothetical protein [Mycobacteriaceae bacterium]
MTLALVLLLLLGLLTTVSKHLFRWRLDRTSRTDSRAAVISLQEFQLTRQCH